MIRNQNILITGGAGFIGSRVVEQLAPHNNVRVLDTLDRNAFATLGMPTDAIELIQGDVRDAAQVREAMQGMDRVLHLASLAGVSNVRNNPTRTMLVTIEGIRNVLEAAKATPSVKRIVAFSTSEVYGRIAYGVSETDATPIEPVAEPRWTYAVAKITAEHLAYAYYKEFGVPSCTIRPFNIYGPGQVGEGAIHSFVTRALNNEPIRIHFDGQQIRSWCFVSDIVGATLNALSLDGVDGNTFNIGNPRATLTVRALAETICRLVGTKPNFVHVTPSYPDVELRVPNVDKARAMLGFEPLVDLEAGLAETIEWYRTQG